MQVKVSIQWYVNRLNEVIDMLTSAKKYEEELLFETYVGTDVNVGFLWFKKRQIVCSDVRAYMNNPCIETARKLTGPGRDMFDVAADFDNYFEIEGRQKGLINRRARVQNLINGAGSQTVTLSDHDLELVEMI